jgi:hypothetical protein
MLVLKRIDDSLAVTKEPKHEGLRSFHGATGPLQTGPLPFTSHTYHQSQALSQGQASQQSNFYSNFRNPYVLLSPIEGESNQADEPVEPPDNPLIHARMYAIADYFEVPGLKKMASTKFQAAAERHWNSDKFGEAVHVAYTSTLPEDRGLRQIVKDILMRHMTLLNKPEIESIMREVPDLAFDMLKGVWNHHGARHEYLLPPPSPTQSAFLSEAIFRPIR